MHLSVNIPFLPQDRKAWLVGGAIRDLLLGEFPSDLDIIAADNAAEYASEIAQKSGYRAIELGKPPFTIHRITTPKHIFDVTDLNGASLREDLLQRDFTINAIAWEIPTGTLIDYTQGKKDLERKTIRMVCDTIFKHDPVRLLRAFRLAASLEFEMEKSTVETITREAQRIQTTAAERIRSELLKILKTDNTFKTITALDTTGLLKFVLPEVTALKMCTQNRHHNLDAFHHTLNALSTLERILSASNGGWDFESPITSIKAHIGSPQELKLALLLHDIGKPSTRTVGSKGNIHFYAHEKIGAQMADDIARRLTLSNAQRNYITSIIKHHLYPLQLFQTHRQGALSKRTIMRFFRKVKEFTPDLLLHAVADAGGKKSDTRRSTPSSTFTDFIQELMVCYATDFKPAQKAAPLITGRDLIEIVGLRPSPLFKTLLEGIEEERFTGQLQTKDDAIKWIKTFLIKNRIHPGS